MDWLKEFFITSATAFFIGLKNTVDEGKRKKFKGVALRLFQAIKLAYFDDPDFS